MVPVEHAPVNDVVLRDEHQHVVEMNQFPRFLFLDGLDVLAETALGERPVRHGEIVFLAGGCVFRAPPVAVRRGIALEVERLLRGLAVARVEHELRHAARVADELGLVGAHVVGHAVLGLAGGVGLEKRRAAIFEAVEHRLVQLGGVGHRNLRHKRRAVPAGERLGDVLLFNQLALRRDAELVHVVTAQHGGGIGVLAAGVGIHLGVEHEHFHVRPVLQDDLGHVLEPDVAERAVAADDPDLRQFADFLVGHQRVVEMREHEQIGRGHDTFLAVRAARRPGVRARPSGGRG